jgi:hypothetical protein
MTDSDLKRYNRVFAEELGCAPNGLPLYKWVRPRELFYMIEYAVDDLTPAGVYVLRDRYKRVTWAEHLGREWQWIIATWQDPGTHFSWYSKYRDVIPYPPNGMYFPISGSEIPCDPTQEITSEAIAKIKGQLRQSYEQHLANTFAEADAEDKRADAERNDQIDSDWPAFNCEVAVPGIDKKEPS